jgi:hypothetical protein
MQTITTISKEFNNKNLKRIVNVYQLKYKNSVAQGLGDYIRGCFCLMQICAMLGLSFDMDLTNHPMSKYLIQQESEKEPKYNINYSEVARYENTNYVPINATTYSKNSINFFIEFVNNLNSMGLSENFFTFCHSFPIFDVQDVGRKFILSKLLPNEMMQTAIKERLIRLELIVKRFAVIHIRSGDKYLLNNGTLNSFVVKKIAGILSKNMKEGTRYLILSDNNQIKLHLKKIFPQIIIQLTKITHLGEGTLLLKDEVKNTMLDFYLFSFANSIHSFTSYLHFYPFTIWSHYSGVQCFVAITLRIT